MTLSVHWPAEIRAARVRNLASRSRQVIRVDAAWFAVEPLDIRAGVDTAVARVVSVSGQPRRIMLSRIGFFCCRAFTQPRSRAFPSRSSATQPSAKSRERVIHSTSHKAVVRAVIGSK
jgi:hypothetical protein